MAVEKSAIRAKFGDNYVASEQTYRLGIDIRLTSAIARRFAGMRAFASPT